MKDVFVIGGPNGAGKSTASNRILPVSLSLRNFLNADEIARGLSPYDPDRAAVPAGRLSIEGSTVSYEPEKASHSRRPEQAVGIFSDCACAVLRAIA